MRETDGKLQKAIHAANDWRSVLSSPHVTQADRLAFDAWLAADPSHERVYDQAETLWASHAYIQITDLDVDVRKPSLAERVTAFIDLIQNAVQDFRTQGAVAVIILLAMLLPLTTVGEVTDFLAPDTAMVTAAYSTDPGRQKTVTLADGSILHLDAGSAVDVVLRVQDRHVILHKGAALFEVAKDKERPFSVTSEGLTATVLGTVFEVRNNGGVTRVGVAEGEVEVSHAFIASGLDTGLNRTEVLTSGKQIAAESAKGLKSVLPVLPERVGAWRSNTVFYEGASLAEIVADANRYSTKKIILGEIDTEAAGQLVTASFSTTEIDQLLKLLPELFPVRIVYQTADVIRIEPIR